MRIRKKNPETFCEKNRFIFSILCANFSQVFYAANRFNSEFLTFEPINFYLLRKIDGLICVWPIICDFTGNMLHWLHWCDLFLVRSHNFDSWWTCIAFDFYGELLTSSTGSFLSLCVSLYLFLCLSIFFDLFFSLHVYKLFIFCMYSFRSGVLFECSPMTKMT